MQPKYVCTRESGLYVLYRVPDFKPHHNGNTPAPPKERKVILGALALLFAYEGTTLGQIPQIQYQEAKSKPGNAQQAFIDGDFKKASELFAQQWLEPDAITAAEPHASEKQLRYASANFNALEAAILGNLVAANPANNNFPRFYLGGEFGENYDRIFGDALVPLKEPAKDLPFLYFHGASDHDWEKWTLAGGGGYRFQTKGPVLGINALVGADDSGSQTYPWVRLQAELLGLAKNIDVRADYKVAWDDDSLLRRTEDLVWRTSTFEELRSGFHSEAGVWLPAGSMGIGLFGGYGAYERAKANNREEGMSSRIEFDFGNVVFAAQYRGFGDAKWAFGPIFYFGKGSRTPRVFQSPTQLLTEPMKFQPSQFRKWTEYLQKEEFPPPAAYPRPKLLIVQGSPIRVVQYEPVILGANGQPIHPAHPHGAPPGQEKKEPIEPPYPQTSTQISATGSKPHPPHPLGAPPGLDKKPPTDPAY